MQIFDDLRRAGACRDMHDRLIAARERNRLDARPECALLTHDVATGLATVGVPFEERRLERAFGDSYRAYRRRVPRWL